MNHKKNSRLSIIFSLVLLGLIILGAAYLGPVVNGGQDNPPGITSLEEAVSEAIRGQRNNYGLGEVATEGHIILDTEEKNGVIKVYTIASYAAFGFENGIFTHVSGSGAIPTVMTFSRAENGGYSLLEYKEPMDGAGNLSSIKEMFPTQLQSRVISANKEYPALELQKEAQAAAYLKSIGRTAQISAIVERKLININVEASNKLLNQLTKNPKLIDCPYWLGTREKIENGIRYIYETSQSKTGEGLDLVIFKKTNIDGTVVLESKFKIVGSDPVPLP